MHYNSVIIGACHNGLTCAAYLAGAGFRVRVVERRDIVGGAAVTKEFHPGFRNSTASYTVSLLHPKVIADLRLAEHGLRIVERPLANFLPFPDGKHLKMGGSLAATQAEVAKFSVTDASRLPAYYAMLERVAGLLRALTPGEAVAGAFGEHRHVARLHQGRDRAPAPGARHLRPAYRPAGGAGRQVPCRRARFRGPRPDVPPGAEDRSRSQGAALGAAQGSGEPGADGPGRAGRAHRPSDDQARQRAPGSTASSCARSSSAKQFHVVSALLAQWCTNVMRSKVEPMKQVARLIRNHFEGIVAWTQTRQTNGFLEALNGLFQAAKRKARGYTRFKTMRTVLFLIAGKLDFTSINPHAA
jgi:hypothetical protein